MRALMIIAAAALSLSCSRPVTPPGAALAQETAGRVAGPPQTCISSNRSENLRVLDPQTLAYGFGRTIYINHLPAACPGLSMFNTIIVEADDGMQYCRNNRIRALEPGAIIPGPTCVLGDWVPYTRP
ncbi:hypothetical protein [Sphingomonas segetis]|jgi:hypothetical protein|uniref:hypothetical protein n=1 Tax=Sphingomonas segetis TaxID=1104779 RepID=UPI0012D2AF16|nr:hypothetical protein [Sphingomonas segetis]